ncbi:MAG: LUD domain-containing protein [Hyphomicrobium sp.]
MTSKDTVQAAAVSAATVNMDGRSAILSRIRSAIGKGRSEGERAASEMALPSRLKPVRPPLPAGTLAHFKAKCEANLISVQTLAHLNEVPGAVAHILAQANMAPDISVAPSLRDLVWPATMTTASAKARITEKLTVTRAAAGIAETGTCVVCSGDDAPSSLTFAPELNVIVLDEAGVVAYLEDGLALVKTRYAPWPRTVNLVSGPSRTADVAGIVVRPAHGPKAVHLLLVSAPPAP